MSASIMAKGIISNIKKHNLSIQSVNRGPNKMFTGCGHRIIGAVPTRQSTWLIAVAWRRDSVDSLVADPVADVATVLTLAALLSAQVLESWTSRPIHVMVLTGEAVLTGI